MDGWDRMRYQSVSFSVGRAEGYSVCADRRRKSAAAAG